jgi:hypothetical protein
LKKRKPRGDRTVHANPGGVENPYPAFSSSDDKGYGVNDYIAQDFMIRFIDMMIAPTESHSSSGAIAHWIAD